jgi:hypothetical protein
MKIEDYLHLYLGCDTNHGKLVGINESTCFILSQSGEINLEDLKDQSQSIKPILRKFSDMNNNESTELNKRGISIGQRKGFSFTPDAVLYLLNLHIDIFNLIAVGLAIDLNQPNSF